MIKNFLKNMKLCFDNDKFVVEDFTPVDYDTLNSTFVGDAVISAAYERWSELGFIEGLDDEDAERLAVAYDNLSYDFLTGNEDIEEISDNLEDKVKPEVILYVTAKAVLKRVDNFDYKKFIKYLKVASTIWIDEDKVDDYEVEYCNIMADFIVRKFNEEEE